MLECLKGKKAVITGIASDRSIAYGIADSMHQAGAELVLTYQTEKLKARAEKFATGWNHAPIFECDVGNDQSIEAFFTALKTHWGQFDILVHSIGYAPQEALSGDFTDATTRENFQIAHDISSYSLIALAKAARPFFQGSGAILTLTYLGSQRAMPNYNVMGLAKASLEAGVRYLAQSLGADNIRVNAISAGPIRTLAASGVSGIRDMLKVSQERSALKKNVTTEEVGHAATFLCSDYASGITGEILFVDAGFQFNGGFS